MNLVNINAMPSIKILIPGNLIYFMEILNFDFLLICGIRTFIEPLKTMCSRQK